MNSIEEIIKEDATEYTYLRQVVVRLNDADLGIPLEAGWTLSAMLAHLAFRDKHAITLIGKWKKSGVGPSPINTDVVNEATHTLCQAIEARHAAELAVRQAYEIDRTIANLTPALSEVIRAKSIHHQSVLRQSSPHSPGQYRNGPRRSP